MENKDEGTMVGRMVVVSSGGDSEDQEEQRRVKGTSSTRGRTKRLLIY
jgi:hypothetical protein